MIEMILGAKVLFETIGWFGAVFFGICAFPQVYHIWKTKEVKGLSWLFLILWTLGEIFTWTYVGWLNLVTGIWQIPLHFNYLVNSISLVYLIYSKWRYKDE